MSPFQLFSKQWLMVFRTIKHSVDLWPLITCDYNIELSFDCATCIKQWRYMFLWYKPAKFLSINDPFSHSLRPIRSWVLGHQAATLVTRVVFVDTIWVENARYSWLLSKSLYYHFAMSRHQPACQISTVTNPNPCPNMGPRLLHSLSGVQTRPPRAWHWQFLWLPGLNINLRKPHVQWILGKLQCIISSQKRWEFSLFLKPLTVPLHSPRCTALTTGKCLSLGLCKGDC